MSTPDKPLREYPSTYFVQDRSNQEELQRVHLQDQLITLGMGGVLPEQLDPGVFRQILDVGCGTGNWLIQLAKMYPTATHLVGVDISNKMLDAARVEAEAQGVQDRVKFQSGDALRMLEFPDNTFDLVNERFGWSYLRTIEWPQYLNECYRVLRHGGVLRISESDIVSANSPAIARLTELALQAFYQAGNFPVLDRRGVIEQLEPLLKRFKFKDVQTLTHVLEYRAGTPEGVLYFKDLRYFFRTIVPFLRKWTRVPDDYEAIYQQALSEMEQADFVAVWTLVTAWGTKY